MIDNYLVYWLSGSQICIKFLIFILIGPQPQTAFGFGQQASAFGTPTQTSFGGFGQPGPSNAFGGAKSTPFGFGQSAGNGFGFQGPQPGPSSGFNTQNSAPFGIPGPSSATTQGMMFINACEL